MMVALAAGSLLMTAAVPLASADDLKHKKHRVEHHIASARTDLDESSAQLRAATAVLQRAKHKLDVAQVHLAETRGELAGARSLDQQMQAKLQLAVQRLSDVRTELASGRAKMAGQERTLGKIVVQNYQTGDPSLLGLSMVLTSQDPNALTGQLNSVQNVLDKETVTLDRLKASKVLLIVQEHEVEKAKAEVVRQREAAAANLTRKWALEKQAVDAKAKVADLVSARQSAHKLAQSARASDLSELHRLQRESDRISTLLKKRAEEARRRAEAARKRAEAARRRAHAAAAPHSSAPVHSSGFLDYPVNAVITSPFGWRVHPIYGYRSLHDGIDLGAGCGTPIRAAADGRVLEEYFQTAWGNRLVLDHGYHHGAGLATIYNHLSRYQVRSGRYVHQGDVIGYVGTTGWSTGCHLHFTVMQNGVPVNPLKWL